MIHTVRVSTWDRTDILAFLRNKRQEGSFRCIDVGGTASGWSAEVIDAICDINTPTTKSIRHFQMDITNPDDWTQVDAYVKEHGKFDFSICTHTLEDISNPKYVLKKLADISKEGYIAVPSKYIELARFEDSRYPYRGYIHHRWIFSIRDNRFVGYPKIPYLEQDSFFDSIASTKETKKDLSFYWKDSIPFSIINNDYLGPSGDAIVTYYRTLKKDDLDI